MSVIKEPQSKKGVLLINLGTPASCDKTSVRRYLTEFLNDPRVIDLPAFIRWPLVNGVLVPFRYKKTTQAYQKIWSEAGSPLLHISRQIKMNLATELADYQVELGMRYGEPNIPAALAKLKHCDSLTVVPLFPQYTSAATGSAIQALIPTLANQWNIPKLVIKKDFYQQSGFIASYVDIIKQHIAGKKLDLLLFSYHGLPERHIHKSKCQAECSRLHACPVINPSNLFCYRAQCYATTHSIAKQLGLNEQDYLVSFQSRLGRTPWIKPYTDLLLPELIKKGTKRIAIVSPSFIADCLETLEEINIRAREQWYALGGEDFTFIPCINHSPRWIKALAEMVRES